MFVVKHEDIFTFDVELHKINTRHKWDFHVPSVNLTKVKKEFIIQVLYCLTPYL